MDFPTSVSCVLHNYKVGMNWRVYFFDLFYSFYVRSHVKVTSTIKY